jgi:hypothetical protein
VMPTWVVIVIHVSPHVEVMVTKYFRSRSC